MQHCVMYFLQLQAFCNCCHQLKMHTAHSRASANIGCVTHVLLHAPCALCRWTWILCYAKLCWLIWVLLGLPSKHQKVY
jgi:hypothetical protein